MFHTNRGMNLSIVHQKVMEQIHSKWIYQFNGKTNFNKIFSERQRELKRIGNMIDDIIASKWSRTVEKTAQTVRLHKSDKLHTYSLWSHANQQI